MWEDNQRNYSRTLLLQLSYLLHSSEGHVLEVAGGQDVLRSSPRQGIIDDSDNPHFVQTFRALKGLCCESDYVAGYRI